MSARNVLQTTCPKGPSLLSREQAPHVPHRHWEPMVLQVVDDALLVLPRPATPIRVPARTANMEVVTREVALRGVALAREAKLGRHDGAPRGNVDCNSLRISVSVIPEGCNAKVRSLRERLSPVVRGRVGARHARIRFVRVRDPPPRSDLSTLRLQDRRTRHRSRRRRPLLLRALRATRGSPRGGRPPCGSRLSGASLPRFFGGAALIDGLVSARTGPPSRGAHPL